MAFRTDGTSGVEFLEQVEVDDLYSNHVNKNNMSTMTDDGDNEHQTDTEIDAVEMQALHERVDEVETAVTQVDDTDDQNKMTIELIDCEETDCYGGVTSGISPATAIQHMSESDIQLLE